LVISINIKLLKDRLTLLSKKENNDSLAIIPKARVHASQ